MTGLLNRGANRLSAEWQPFSELKKHFEDYPGHPITIFEDLVHYGIAERKIENIERHGIVSGSRHYYRLSKSPCSAGIVKRKGDEMDNELLGKEVEYIGRFRRCSETYPTRIVVGIDPIKGITLAAPEEPSIRACITPEYFGAGYAGAYFETISMLRSGFFDPGPIDKYATVTMDGFAVLAPNCPYS